MKLINFLLSLLYPRKCPFCTRLIDEDMRICRKCEKKLPFIPSQLMPRSFPYVDECYSVFYYEGDVRESILRYKFSAAAAYAEIYGTFLAKCIDENDISCDIITWVPLSKRRYRKRGYDQAKLLAMPCGEHTGIKYAQLLRKIRNNPAQSGVADAAARKANVAGAYELYPGRNINGNRVLLVDDVVTTGSTLSECAKTLKQAGAAQVIAITLAAAFK